MWTCFALILHLLKNNKRISYNEKKKSSRRLRLMPEGLSDWEEVAVTKLIDIWWAGDEDRRAHALMKNAVRETFGSSQTCCVLELKGLRRSTRVVLSRRMVIVLSQNSQFCFNIARQSNVPDFCLYLPHRGTLGTNPQTNQHAKKPSPLLVGTDKMSLLSSSEIGVLSRPDPNQTTPVFEVATALVSKATVWASRYS